MDAELYRTSGQMIKLSNALIWFRNRELDALGLTSSQFEVVRYLLLHIGEEVTAGVLMRELGLSQSTVAGILKRLCDKCIIDRRQDESDTRRSFVRLTPKGLALEEELQGIALRSEDVLLRGMTEAEAADFYRLLSLAHSNMNSVRDEAREA